eukprot:scaffold36484_cov229-Amphora_coffeaeformis.AAC.13
MTIEAYGSTVLCCSIRFNQKGSSVVLGLSKPNERTPLSVAGCLRLKRRINGGMVFVKQRVTFAFGRACPNTFPKRTIFGSLRVTFPTGPRSIPLGRIVSELTIAHVETFRRPM